MHITKRQKNGNKFYDMVIKRVCDIVLALGGILILFPIYIFISIAIYINDPGPVLFTQKRFGKSKKVFTIHKFRSMKVSAPHDTATYLLENPEKYITKVGKFLRKYSLDEIPQLIDILVGNMSFIGPRPVVLSEVDLIVERDRYGANDIKPGLTGWAQVNGRDRVQIKEKARLDGLYARNESLWFDIKIFFRTIVIVIKHIDVIEGDANEVRQESMEIVEEGICIRNRRIG